MPHHKFYEGRVHFDELYNTSANGSQPNQAIHRGRKAQSKIKAGISYSYAFGEVVQAVVGIFLIIKNQKIAEFRLKENDD
jgi:hypothetical protein